MRKRTVWILVLTIALGWTSSSQAAPAGHSSHEAKAGLAAETSVAATPAWENLTPTVGTWVEGTLKTIRDAEALKGMVWLQVDYKLPQEWKVGVKNWVAFSYTTAFPDPKWVSLRLLAEKPGFVDTGSVANKFVLRVEPRTTAETKDNKIVDAYSRFDFTFPVQGALSLKLREEPRFDFNENPGAEFFYNGVELGPVVTVGSLLWNPNLVNWQRVNNNSITNAGFAFDSYVEYGLTSNLAVDLYTKYESPYTASADFVDGLEWSVELYYAF